MSAGAARPELLPRARLAPGAGAPPGSRLRAGDLLRVASVGLRTRRLRAALSALGIAIGIAAMVAVLGISESSKAGLIAELDKLGTNLLTITPGQTFLGENAELPDAAARAVRGLPSVRSSAAVTAVSGVTVRRTPFIEAEEDSGITVEASDPQLLEALGGAVLRGHFIGPANERLPEAVLGSVAAKRLGVSSLLLGGRGVLVYIGGKWFGVAGILGPQPLAPEIERAALIGYPIAKRLFGTTRHASAVYVRADPDHVLEADALLPATADPQNPEETQVSRPSDALQARADAQSTLTSIFLALGAVALLVGGVGIANVMVISVLERRPEIGLRRALGARSAHIAAQFLGESILLSLLGGCAGVALGAVATAIYAAGQGWRLVVPLVSVCGAVGLALALGALAGLYPAIRAARLAPAAALRSV